MQSIVDIENLQNTYGSEYGRPVDKLLSQAKHDHTLLLLGVNHIAMWTRLLTLVNPLSVGHKEMWTMGVNHIKMWTIGVKSHGNVN